MKTRTLVTLCWVQVFVAACFVVLNIYMRVVRPMPGLEYSRESGKVVSVTDGGPAARAGIAVDDRVISISGHRVGLDVYPLAFARAGETVPVVYEREGVTRSAQVQMITLEELRRASFFAGGARTLNAISSYIAIPLHIWMIGLGIVLLWLRSDHYDARISALSLVYWAGTLFIYQLTGFGVVLQQIPEILRVPMIVIDALFTAGFFALCLHFALIFPSDRVGLHRAWEVLPYVIAAPMFIETIAHGMRRVRGDVHQAALPWGESYSTIGTALLLASLVTLAVRYRRMQDANARRRVKLVFFSLLPGVSIFALDFAGESMTFGRTYDQVMNLLTNPATMLGSTIYAYAVVRHRIYNVRVLVRRSLQYALARSTLLALMSLPVLFLAVFLYLHRRESIAVLLTGTPAVYLLLIVPLLFVIRYRKRLLEGLDRRFFREQYDARRLLLHVVSIIRSGSDLLGLSRAALEEIDKALHPKHISLWQVDAEGEAVHRGFYRGEDAQLEVVSLPANGTLASLLSTDDEPLDVHSRTTRALLKRLPEAEREWLQQSGAYLIVPLLLEKRLVGLMVLGERKSEEPYSSEDRELLRTLGAQLAFTLDYARLKQSPSLVWSPAPVHLFTSDVLQLCPKCGRCYAPDANACEIDQQTLVPESGVPRIIEDKYVVTRLLGRGGMGSVYLATQKRLNRPVAVKVLLSHLVGSSSMRSRFEREARIVARLRHPAIVTIHDFGVLASGHAYLVMEYLHGETLRKTIVGGPQPIGPAMNILRPVGDAIDAAHRAGIVHRDLKPENIMLVKDHDVETPRVLDFGLAKMSNPIGDDEQTLVQSGHSAGVVGTLMYMAPEVLSGHAADAKADQYSLALIAYELIAGEHPLGTATSLASVVRGHTDLPLIPITDRVPQVPRNVADAIHRALSKKAEDRFASVGEFIAAMEQ